METAMRKSVASQAQTRSMAVRPASAHPARPAGARPVSVPQQQAQSRGLSAPFPKKVEAPVSRQVCSALASTAGTTPKDDDVVIVSSLRTPCCRAGKRGGLKDTDAVDMLSAVLKGVIDQTKINPLDIGDLVIGSVLGDNVQRANEARIASFFAGIPKEVPVRILNRQCSSSLQAIADVAASIKAGYYSVGIAGGVETMTRNPMPAKTIDTPLQGTYYTDKVVPKKFEKSPEAAGILLNMVATSDTVAERFQVSRQTQDEFAFRSIKLAMAAQAAGKFKEEIVPVPTKLVDTKTMEEKDVVISEDDGIPAKETYEGLAKQKPMVKGGFTTAGNASQMTDGAAACLMMSRAEAKKRGLPILGVFRSFAAVGVEPCVMGIGPAKAIPAALQLAGLKVEDIDVFEINEAFASQATYCVKELGIDVNKVNPNGGAIALGHPLGATGARCTATLLHEMKRRGKDARYGMVSMCIGSGMGAAAVFEREA